MGFSIFHSQSCRLNRIENGKWKKWVSDVVELVEWLSRRCKSLDSIPNTNKLGIVVPSALERGRQGDQKFKLILGT